MRVIIPFTAGGAPDVLMRMVAQKLSEKWGQGVVIENRPGGNTLTGTVAGAKSDPDGYTLLLAADQTFVLNPLLYASLPYSMKELEPIILMASIPHMLAVANKVPVSSVSELIALAKAKPNTLMYGTTGPGHASSGSRPSTFVDRRHQAGARALSRRATRPRPRSSPARST